MSRWVLLDYRRYQQLLEAEAKLEDLELLVLAVQRGSAVRSGRDELIPLEEVLAEFGIAADGTASN